MNSEFPKAYDPRIHEDEIYRRWSESGFFSPPDKPSSRGRFSIVMPPPNVTGSLHIGHAVMLALEDLMTRYHRMKGQDTLWLPGLDHAAIATQNVVEKQLKKEGTNRHELGREKFLERVYAFVAESKNCIRTQIRKIGASCDWSREAYTLDEGRSRQVQEMFVRMYQDGLIYRGNRIVNWCPRCASTLADDEVKYKAQKTKFYYFKYGPVVIGTARPETKFLDKTIVVHPDDPRYKNLHWREMEIEWIEGKIKANVIADLVANPEFGTGAMTITPAHSFEDFDLAQKYKLPVVQIIDEKGNLTEAAGEFAGQNARKAREAIVEKLRSKGLVDHIDENYVHNLSVCYRCETPVEPLPKLQWFIDVNKPVVVSSRPGYVGVPGVARSDPPRGKPAPPNTPPTGSAKSLRQLAVEAVEMGAIKIVPERFVKQYFEWMNNLRDWCISRQIWFGHEIPAWHRGEEVHVGSNLPEGEGWVKDPDVLDTWFSSGMWTFSTLTHPGDLERFHPTDVLETGYDILFFWVARMILMTTYARREMPFKTVYLHGLVRDMQGRKMSKSIGNVIDPIDMIEKYGADATRIALFIGTSPGADSKLNEQKIAGYRNFANKIWNIVRFVLITAPSEPSELDTTKLTFADEWILSRTRETIREVTRLIDEFQFSQAFERAYDFAWHEFADWYVEAAKVINTPVQHAVLHRVASVILRLLHPAMPFVTEILWGKLGNESLLMVAPWPKEDELPATTDDAIKVFTELQRVVTFLRNNKGEGLLPESPYTEEIFWTIVKRLGRVQE